MSKRERLPLVIMVEMIGAHGGMHWLDVGLCEAMANQPVELVWATCDETDLSGQRCRVWLVFRGIFGDAPGWRRGLRYASGLCSILWYALRERLRRPVIIHEHFITVLPLEAAFVILARILGVRCVLTPHDTVPFFSNSLVRAVLPYFYRLFNGLVVHTSHSQNQLRELAGPKAAIWHVPLGQVNSAHQSHSGISPAEARSMLALPESACVILFFGRIRVQKGLEYLIMALDHIVKQIPSAILVIAGNPGHNDAGPYIELVSKLGLDGHVRARWEYIADEEVEVYYKAADVVALPYTEIDQSAVVLTAFAFGRPVVATSVGGLCEQIKDGVTGVLVPPRDPLALARAIVQLLESPDAAKAMGQAGWQWAESDGDWDRIAEMTMNVYREVLGGDAR